MTKQKRNLERRESTVREFRTITSSKDRKSGYDLLGIDASTSEINKIYESNKVSMEKKLAAALEIKKMEATGIFSRDAIEKEKIKLGIITDDKSSIGSSSTNVTDVIITQIANEQDPNIRLSLTQTLVSLEMMNKSGGQNSALATLQNTMNKGGVTPKTNFETQMTELMMKKFLEEPKSELDNLDKLSKLFEGVQKMLPQNNPLQEMKDNLKLFQDMGIAVTPGNTIEEKRLELETKRMDKELQLEEKKIDVEAERTKSLANVAGDVLSSVFSAVGAAKEDPKSSAGPSKEFVDESLEAKCVNNNCGTSILITNSKTDRDVFCPKCNQKYQYQSDKKQLFLVQDNAAVK